MLEVRGYVGINLSECLPFVLMLPAQIEASVAENNQWRISVRLAIRDDEWLIFGNVPCSGRHRRLIQLERGARQ